MQRVCGGVAVGVHPGFSVEAVAFDDERVALPASNRVALPGGIGVLGEREAVGQNLTEDGARFIQENREAGSLYDSPRRGDRDLLREARGEAEVFRVVLAQRVAA